MFALDTCLVLTPVLYATSIDEYCYVIITAGLPHHDLKLRRVAGDEDVCSVWAWMEGRSRDYHACHIRKTIWLNLGKLCGNISGMK
jgi:hypothetical protein